MSPLVLLGACLLAVLALAALCLWALAWRWRRAAGGRPRCLVVLGSGGHTAEMLYDLRSLGGLLARLDFAYLLADTDRGSRAHVEAFERERGAASPPEFLLVPRAREVGQSYLTSVFSTLKAGEASLRHVLAQQPDVVLCNGPGTCVPVVLAARLLRLLGIKRVSAVYSESFACVDHLSLSGRIVYRLVDRFTVQWPHLLRSHPGAEYAGRLYAEREVEHCRQSSALPPPADLPELPAGAQAGSSTAIVTIGSTKFDALIRAVDCLEFAQALRRLGITKLKVQRGNGYMPATLLCEEIASMLEVEVVDYTPSMPEEIRQAALVISHAGAGTILDCLQAGRRLVVVPNEGLMANHQAQLGRALQEQRLLLCRPAAELVAGLGEADFGALRRFPERPGAAFARCVGELALGAAADKGAPAAM